MSERNPPPPPKGHENVRFRETLSGYAVLSICTGILLVAVAAIGIVFDALSRL